jgi:ligand-binding sensor domain-containing protein
VKKFPQYDGVFFQKRTMVKISYRLSKFVLLAGLALSCMMCGLDAHAQNIQFKHLTINDGLSHSWIRSICQDTFGFMWIGTDDGLNRYDGYNFHVYRNEIHNESSISSSSTNIVFEDSKGNLWIGTRQGLDLYDRPNDRFIRYPQWANQIIWLLKNICGPVPERATCQVYDIS